MQYPEAAASIFAVVDLQEKLVGAMADPEGVLARAKVLVEGANALSIPLVVTEQYPKGLGNTVAPLKELFPEGTPILEKSSFSCWAEEGFRNAVGQKRTLVLFGVETHVCVLQTALDAVYAGHEVIVISDAVSSRRESDKAQALALFRENGIKVMSSEMLLFLYMRDSKHPSFKSISKIIR